MASKKFYQFLLILAISIYFLIYSIYEINEEKIKNSKNDYFKRLNRKIFCMILTQPRNVMTKALAVNQTWARYCDKYFFIVRLDLTNTDDTIETFNPIPILQPAGYKYENYSLLTDKMFYTYKYIYSKYKNYDWYLKADDDTFIFMDNLRKFLIDKNPNEPKSFGRNWNILVKDGYESGGAGYVLSNEAMMRLGAALDKNFSYCNNTGIEDVDTSKCLKDLGGESGNTLDHEHSQRFFPYHYKTEVNYKKFSSLGLNKISRTAISFHYMDVADMFKLYNLCIYYKKKFKNINVKLLLYELLE